MNCRDWEERLALYLGGDLPREEAAEVERHLGECPGCQLFSSGLKEARELLQQIHSDPVGPVHFTAVRARVLAELERRQRPLWRRGWVLSLAAAAAALLVLLAVWPIAKRVPQPPRVAVKNSPAPQEPVADRPDTASVTAPQPRIPGAARQRQARPKRLPGEPVLIKVVSNNPDVVIYWIADTRGD
jgi:anti-sigma factor RsiW